MHRKQQMNKEETQSVNVENPYVGKTHTLDMLRPGVVRQVLGKVDGTLTVAIEPVFILPNAELTDEVLHPQYFLGGFHSRHVLRLYG